MFKLISYVCISLHHIHRCIQNIFVSICENLNYINVEFCMKPFHIYGHRPCNLLCWNYVTLYCADCFCFFRYCHVIFRLSIIEWFYTFGSYVLISVTVFHIFSGQDPFQCTLVFWTCVPGRLFLSEQNFLKLKSSSLV